MHESDRWAVRQRKAAGVTVGSDGSIENIDWSVVRRWQREFQEEFCRDCCYFDLRNRSFLKQGGGGDCARHVTDIIGQCWNFRPDRLN